MKNESETQHSIWLTGHDQWCKAYADEMMQGDYDEGAPTKLSTVMMGRITDAEKELKLIEEQLKIHISDAEKNITAESDILKNKRDVNSDSINKKKAYIDKNKSSGTRQIDKLDEKSRAYLTTTFYSISLITMSFFIYKQLKQ